MKHLLLGFLTLMALLLSSAHAQAPAAKQVRLFILSGQSNMVGLREEKSFTPAVTKAFPDDEVIVVKYAVSGRPIRLWYKGWKSPAGMKVKGENGTIYDDLMAKVKEATEGKASPVSVTFVWMQGEEDAKRNATADIYADALKGLIDQLQTDLGRKDVDVVLGRLSDAGNEDKKIFPGWMTIRAAQEQFVAPSGRSAWIDTDDLNGDNNNLHYNGPGYQKLGERFAEKAIELIAKRK